MVWGRIGLNKCRVYGLRPSDDGVSKYISSERTRISEVNIDSPFYVISGGKSIWLDVC